MGEPATQTIFFASVDNSFTSQSILYSKFRLVSKIDFTDSLAAAATETVESSRGSRWWPWWRKEFPDDCNRIKSQASHLCCYEVTRS